MLKEAKPIKQILILLFLFALALAISLVVAKSLKSKTAATADEIQTYQNAKIELESIRVKVEKYRDEHDNSLPDSLADMVPDYFVKEPQDPYGNVYDYDKWQNGGVALLSFLGRDGVPKGFGINKDYVLRLKQLKE